MESHDRVNSLCDAIDVSVQTSNSALPENTAKTHLRAHQKYYRVSN